MALFFERGYDAVTVADIAERAGLTKRSLFNHFADKPAIVFVSVDGLADDVIAALADIDRAMPPLRAAVLAFERATTVFDDYRDVTRQRRDLIDSSTELQERELSTLRAVGHRIALTLVERGVPQREAEFAAASATTVFTTAFDEWARGRRGRLATAIRHNLAAFIRAVGAAE